MDCTITDFLNEHKKHPCLWNIDVNFKNRLKLIVMTLNCCVEQNNIPNDKSHI